MVVISDYAMMKKATESQEQKALFQWIRMQPEIKGIAYSIPNGSVLAGNASKRAIQMNSLKATGLLLGVPDICIPLPRNGYGALYVELKVESGGKVTQNQHNVIDALNKAGNMAIVCNGADEAITAIQEYLA